jgi:hypothetical protein
VLLIGTLHRRYLFVANEAQIRKAYPEDQLNQAAASGPTAGVSILSIAVWVIRTVQMQQVVIVVSRIVVFRAPGC